MPETVVTNDCISTSTLGEVHVYTDQDKKYSPYYTDADQHGLVLLVKAVPRGFGLKHFCKKHKKTVLKNFFHIEEIMISVDFYNDL